MDFWAVEGLFYMLKHDRFTKEVSVNELKGTPATGNKGLCDLLIYKHSLKRQFFQREPPLRANDLLVNTDVPFTKWLEHDVEPRMNSYMAWMQEEASANLTWRAGRSPSEIRWLSFIEEILFGTRWDAAVKVLTKAGTMPADALSQGVFGGGALTHCFATPCGANRCRAGSDRT